jgi:hypothetical protein
VASDVGVGVTFLPREVGAGQLDGTNPKANSESSFLTVWPKIPSLGSVG